MMPIGYVNAVTGSDGKPHYTFFPTEQEALRSMTPADTLGCLPVYTYEPTLGVCIATLRAAKIVGLIR